MADKEIDKDAPKQEGKNKSSSVNIVQIIILVLLLATLGLGGFIAWKLVTLDIPIMPGQGQASPPKKAELTPGILMELDNVTVNLADTEDSRFLRVKIKLEVANEEDKAKIEPYKAQIKDLIITLLSGKSYSDVRTKQGKFALKEELAYRINTLVSGTPGRPVESVLFSDFVAQ